MNVIFDDLVNDFVQQFQDRVIPSLGNISTKAKDHLSGKARPPPKSTDLLYITERLIVSSQPSLAWPTPQYNDKGRDDRKPWPKPPTEEEEEEEAAESSQNGNDPSTHAQSMERDEKHLPESHLPLVPDSDQDTKLASASAVSQSTSRENQNPSDSNPVQEKSAASVSSADEANEQIANSVVENPQEGTQLSVTAMNETNATETKAAASTLIPNSSDQSSNGPSPVTNSDAVSPNCDTATSPMSSTPSQQEQDNHEDTHTISKIATSVEETGVPATSEKDLNLTNEIDNKTVNESHNPTSGNVSSPYQQHDIHIIHDHTHTTRDSKALSENGASKQIDLSVQDQSPDLPQQALHTDHEQEVNSENDSPHGLLHPQTAASDNSTVLTNIERATPSVNDSNPLDHDQQPQDDQENELLIQRHNNDLAIDTGPPNYAKGDTSELNSDTMHSHPVPETPKLHQPTSDETPTKALSEETAGPAPPVSIDSEDSDGTNPTTISDNDENDVGMEKAATEMANQSSVPTAATSRQTPPPASALHNSPATIASYLEERHGKEHFLAFSLTDERPDDRTLLLFRRQIVQLGWWSPCIERSHTPSISKIMQICYALHAYLQLNPKNVALIYCSNGKTRTAIVVACYLKYVGLVESSRNGFLHFLTNRCTSQTNPEDTWKQLPPSLQTFFSQFDVALELGGFLNRKPLLLRAIALQGIPVEDKPCLDIWDSSKKHVYTSHPEMWRIGSTSQGGAVANSNDSIQESHERPRNLSQWADEEGFYKVNVVLEGDFLLLCRFGGNFAEEPTTHDPSKILFRYVNTTGFLSGGYPYELSPEKVDLSRQYASHLDDDDFLVTLLFEAEWEHLGDNEGGDEGEHGLAQGVVKRLKEPSRVASERFYRCYETESCEEGWKVILRCHSARPDKLDIDFIQQLYRAEGLVDCKEHLVCIALQLTNFELSRTKKLLLDSPFSWWRHSTVEKVENSINEHPSSKSKKVAPKTKNSVNTGASNEILKLLDEVNVEANFEEQDLLQLRDLTRVSVLEQHKSPPQLPLQQKEDPFVRNSGWMVSSMSYPRQGEILRSFTTHYRQFHMSTTDVLLPRPSVVGDSRPRVPLFPRESTALIPPKINEDQNGNLSVDDEFPIRDPVQEVASAMHDQVNHTGVSLHGLVQLLEISQTWTGTPMQVEESDSEDEEVPEEEEIRPTRSREASMNREAKEQKQKEWEDAQKAEAKEKERQKAEDARRKELEVKQQEGDQTPSEPTSGTDPPLKDDPEYAKYFKMLKMGMPKEQVLHAMTRDQKDQTVLDLDPNKSLKEQRPEKSDGEVPLKEDPEYEKYFKMLKMGLPMGAVKNALVRDGKDPSVMDLDPTKSLKSQLPSSENEDDGPPLKDDPEYAKYFKMLKMGLPVGAVKNALTRDGKDPGIMDLDPDKSLKSQTAGTAEASDTGPALKDDPEYAKYFKMLAMGLPMGAVKNALVRDQKDPSIMDLDPNKSIKSQLGGSQTEQDSGPPLKDDPEYAKYFKMLSMGLPIGAVKNALSRDGKDPAIMDLDPNKSVQSQLGGAEEKDTGTPLKEDPEYTKYFKMLGMGLPPGAVKNALERDGKNPAILDMDPNKSVAFQLKKKGASNKKPAKKKKKVRRKKIYWNPIDPSKLKEDSMWNIVRGAIVMDKLNYDQKEFEDLFTESADPADKKKEKKETKKEEKKLVQVIDPKRSMNGGIVLARLKTDHATVAEIINRMEHGRFDSTQLKALKEYLADSEEQTGLLAYMKKGEKDPELRAKLFSECSETEKYMVTMVEVANAGAKLDAMLFRNDFKNRFEESTEAIRILNNACDELRSSEKLRKLMAIILTVVNQINTGGEGKMAMGFTLDALLKLNEAKAFDRKTSVLHYVVKLVKKNDVGLLAFDSDLPSVTPAESVLLDGLSADVKLIADELVAVNETVKVEAEHLEQAGDLAAQSVTDLSEQKTSVHSIDISKGDSHAGRTPMERFTLSAKVACEQASESITNVKKKYAALLQYFGEDEQMTTGDFFGTLRRFIAEWRKAVEQVEAIENKEAKERKRAAAKAAKEAKAKAKGKASSREKSIGVETGSSTKGEKNTTNASKTGDAGVPTQNLAQATAAAALEKETRSSGATSIGESNGVSPVELSNAVLKKTATTVECDSSNPESVPPDSAISEIVQRQDPSSLVAVSSPDKTVENEEKPGFAAKAAAYRRRKETKDELEEVGASKFLSSAAAYRKKKSQRDLGVDDKDAADNGDHTEPAVSNETPAADVVLSSLKTPQMPEPIQPAVPDFEGTPEHTVDQIQETKDALDEAQGFSQSETTSVEVCTDDTPGVKLSATMEPSKTTIADMDNNPNATTSATAMEDHDVSENVDNSELEPCDEEGGKPLLEISEVLDSQVRTDGNDQEGPTSFSVDKSVNTTAEVDVPLSDTYPEAVPSLPDGPEEMDLRPQLSIEFIPREFPKSISDDLSIDGDSVGDNSVNDIDDQPEFYGGEILFETPSTVGVNNMRTSGNDVVPSDALKSESYDDENFEFDVEPEVPKRLPPRGVISFMSPVLGQGLDGFFDAARQQKQESARPSELDDSSVAIMANNLQRRTLDSQMSDSWVQGDTIQNFMGWADLAIKASDTESVRNFETSMDLNDPNDFDDESTIATYQDDASVMSWNTPSRSTSYATFENMEDNGPTSEAAIQHAITPAKVAASILFTDSPASSAEFTPEMANRTQLHEHERIESALAFPANDFGLDAGLSFAVEDAGFDDGLGFGENSLSFGGGQNVGFGGNNARNSDDAGSKKGWFRWRK